MDGLADGLALGDADGLADGLALGDADGLADELALGDADGLALGDADGLVDGLALGERGTGSRGDGLVVGLEFGVGPAVTTVRTTVSISLARSGASTASVQLALPLAVVAHTWSMPGLTATYVTSHVPVCPVWHWRSAPPPPGSFALPAAKRKRIWVFELGPVRRVAPSAS